MTEKEELEQKLATLNALREQQKELFSVIMRRFVDTLSAHLTKSAAAPTAAAAAVDEEIKTEPDAAAATATATAAATPKDTTANSPHWLKWMLERFEDVLLTHNEEILPHLDEFRGQVVRSGAPRQITRTFKMFAAFKK